MASRSRKRVSVPWEPSPGPKETDRCLLHQHLYVHACSHIFGFTWPELGLRVHTAWFWTLATLALPQTPQCAPRKANPYMCSPHQTPLFLFPAPRGCVTNPSVLAVLSNNCLLSVVMCGDTVCYTVLGPPLGFEVTGLKNMFSACRDNRGRAAVSGSPDAEVHPKLVHARHF